MKRTKIISLFLSALMVISMTPANSFAAQESTTTTNKGGELVMDKTSKLEEDGTYSINMEAFATGAYTLETIEKPVPLDIVMVMDQSGSLGNHKILEDLKNAASNFAKQVYKDGQAKGVNHRIAVAGFASGAYEQGGGDNSQINGKKDPGWINTGIFLKNGTFKNYMGNGAGYPGYVQFNGTKNPEQSYYVNVGNNYVPLSYVKGAYTKVAMPEDKNAEVYGLIDGNYIKAEYRKAVPGSEKIVPASQPTADDNRTYYLDAAGQKALTWAKPAYRLDTNAIDRSKNYWINPNDWIELGYIKADHSNMFDPNNKGFAWRVVGKTRIRYIEQGNKFRDFISIIKVFDKYDQISGGALTEQNSIAINPSTQVYVKETIPAQPAGWYCNGILIDEYYQIDMTKHRWVYSENGVLKDYNSSQPAYVKQSGITSEEYRDSLMNIATEANGQGSIQQTIINDLASLKSSGATRTGTGIEMGNQIFANNPLDRSTEEDKYRRRIMIVFTDGEPAYYEFDNAEARRAVNEAYKTKNVYDAKVYTVYTPWHDTEAGLRAKCEKMLSHISSDYPNAVYKLGNPVPRSKVNPAGDYAIKHNDRYYGVYYDKQSNAISDFNVNGNGNGNGNLVGAHKVRATNTGETEWYDSNNDVYVKDYYPIIANPGTQVANAAYATTGSQISTLYESLFKKITEENSSVSYPVYLNEQALMRDIIAENFRVTDKTKIEVFYVPGEAKLNNPTDKVTKDNIVWDEKNIAPQLTLNVKECENVNGIRYKEVEGPDGVKVKIELYENNQGNNKSNMDVVDVSGFNYAGKYIGYNHPGEKIRVIITGLEALSTVNPNDKVVTNHPDSGIWPPKGPETGVGIPESTFPQPEVTSSVSEGTFVQDYAKNMNIPIQDLKLGNVEHLQVIDEKHHDYKTFDKPVTVVNNKYGKLTSAGNKLTYSPKTMKWDGYDSFYAFGDHMTDPNQNVWAKINVMPANNVYYEDTFVSNTSEGKTGIEYSGNWDVCQSGPNSTDPEENVDKDNHGWIPVLNGELADTDGTSHHGVVQNTLGSMATAKFTFTGNAVDIYSRTTPKTGTILASLASEDGKIFCGQLVDTISASGDYYQVPTLSFTEQNDGTPLPYGTYTVNIYVTAAAEGRYNYYLDGIRVYSPMQKTDKVVENAYGADELNSVFTEIRQQLIDKNSFEIARSSTGVFIDRLKDALGNPTTEGNTTTVSGKAEPGSFEELGPKNEVYLKPGQQISFSVNTQNGSKYQVGMKALNGQSVNVTCSNNKTMFSYDFNHPGDMYYDAVPDANGIISVINMPTSTGILSVTKLKVTNPSKYVKNAEIFSEKPNSQLLENARSFRMLAMAPPPSQEPENNEPAKPDNVQPGDKDILKPEEQESKPEPQVKPEPEPGLNSFESANSDINKQETDVTEKKNISGILDDIFVGFRNWF